MADNNENRTKEYCTENSGYLTENYTINFKCFDFFSFFIFTIQKVYSAFHVKANYKKSNSSKYFYGSTN